MFSLKNLARKGIRRKYHKDVVETFGPLDDISFPGI